MWNLRLYPLLICITLHFLRVSAIDSVLKVDAVEIGKPVFSSDGEYDDDDDDEDDGAGMCVLSKGVVPNRSNCNQFYICGGSKLGPMLGICPAGMWFDPEHTEDDDIVCIQPEVACTNNQIDMFKYCKCRELFPSGIKAASAKNNDALMETSPQCIVDNEFHMYASAIDCERFFICYNGNVKRMQCKPGLHFNAANGYCDHPIAASCGVRFNEVLTYNYDFLTKFHSQVIDRQCPPTGISFIRHPTQCDAFYYCFNGKKSLQHCAFNEVWNEKTMRCVQRTRFQAEC